MTNTKVNSLQFKLIIEDQATNDFREKVVIDKVNNMFYHIIYKSSNRNKVRDKFGITYFEKLITMQI